MKVKCLKSFRYQHHDKGTMRQVARDTLLANLGQPREKVLDALRAAEMQWHIDNKRIVQGISPIGWFKLFDVVCE